MQNLGRIAATVFGVIYALSPIDVIPDFIPVLGQLDDLGVIILIVLYWMAARGQPIDGETAGGPKASGPVIDIDPAD